MGKLKIIEGNGDEVQTLQTEHVLWECLSLILPPVSCFPKAAK